MKTFYSINSYKAQKKSIVTIGTFDGVHAGHKKILERIKINAQELGCESIVLTFFPHPRMVLQSNSTIKLLNTVAEKIVLFEKMGVDNLIIHPFDLEFSKLSSEEFVKNILVKQLNIQKIIIGYDHRFGKNRSSDINDLIVYGTKFGFNVEQILALEIEENAVSSTKIRQAILDGNAQLAEKFLGYPYLFTGTVEKGKQLGRTIGFPTANLNISETYKLLPKTGVYIVKSNFNSRTLFGLMNIGTRPTLEGKNQTIEVYFLDFKHDIYYKTITIELITFIREEQKFDSIIDLKNQIEKDKIFAENYIKTHF